MERTTEESNILQLRHFIPNFNILTAATDSQYSNPNFVILTVATYFQYFFPR
jgi:hypothetical protein